MDLEQIATLAVGLGGIVGGALVGARWLAERLGGGGLPPRPPPKSLPPQQNTPKEPLAGASLIERNATAHERANQLLEQILLTCREQLQEIKDTRHGLANGMVRVQDAIGEELQAVESRTADRFDRVDQDIREIRQRLPSVSGAE